VLYLQRCTCSTYRGARVVLTEVHVLYLQRCTCCTYRGARVVFTEVHVLYLQRCTCSTYRGARVVLTECARGHLPNMIEPTSSNAYTRATFWELIWQLPQCRNQCEIDIRQQTLRINHGDISE